MQRSSRGLLCFENHVRKSQNTFKSNMLHLWKLILVKPMVESRKKGEIYFNLNIQLLVFITGLMYRFPKPNTNKEHMRSVL
jgi:hypothetical protein